MSWAQEMVARATEIQRHELPEDVVLQTKRIVLDSLGCMFGATDSDVARALLRSLPDLALGDDVTLLGQPRRAGVFFAVLFNGALLRYLDLNDYQDSARMPGPRHGHNSEFLPVVLAVAERERLGGRDVIRAMSTAYDVATAFTECIQGRSLEERGWNMDLRAAFVVPVVAGNMLRLSFDQIVDAVGLAGSRSGLLGILDSDVEENSMAKNLRFPYTAQTALFATYLARAGVSGPVTVIEGQSGLNDSIAGGEFNPAPLTTGFLEHRVQDAILKSFASCFATHGHLTATYRLATTHDLHPEDVERVDVRTTTRVARHTGQPVRRHPTTKETADHSTFYLQATMLRERRIGPEQFTADRLKNPDVQALMERVFVSADERLDDMYPAAEVTITLRDGRRLTDFAQHPFGHRMNPVPDAQVEDKFFSMAEPVIGRADAERLRDLVGTLEEVSDLGPVLALLRGTGH